MSSASSKAWMPWSTLSTCSTLNACHTFSAVPSSPANVYDKFVTDKDFRLLAAGAFNLYVCRPSLVSISSLRVQLRCTSNSIYAILMWTQCKQTWHTSCMRDVCLRKQAIMLTLSHCGRMQLYLHELQPGSLPALLL